MPYLELAIKILEEKQQLMTVEEIWYSVKEKGYDKSLENKTSDDDYFINELESCLIKSLSEGNKVRILKSEKLYYLTTFENLSQLIEIKLDGPFINTFQEVSESGNVKNFHPCMRGYDGMVLFFSIPVGFPIGFYLSSKILDSYFPISSLMLGTILITICFSLLALVYIYFTNCRISVHPDKIEFHRIFSTKILICSIPIKDILSIQAKGLGPEQQIKSDFKFIRIKYTQEGLETTKTFRCHGYINPDTIFNPYRYLIRNHESFVSVRSFLKEICLVQNSEYSEH